MAVKYYADNTFINTFYSANIALENYYADFIFKGDTDRIVYASTDYAFRRRTQLLTKKVGTEISLNTLNFPFMNYKGKPELGTDRKYWKSEINTKGFYMDELGYKVRATPVTFNYEATFYFHTEYDNFYAFQELAWDDSDETQINYEVALTSAIDNEVYSVPNIGILGYNLDYDSDYNENDWLQQNKIHTVKADFELQTYLLKGNTSGFALTEKTILDFYTCHTPNDGETLEQVITYFNE